MKRLSFGLVAWSVWLFAGCGGGSGIGTTTDGQVGQCGNNVLEQGEECDGADLGGETCQSLGWDGGNLGCTNQCMFDVSACEGTGPVCGNNAAEYGEECDGADLGGATCQTLGFNGGSLACTVACTYDTSSCSGGPDCGDGQIQGSEQCDGNNLGGATCQSLGFDGGTLACGVDCTYDTTNCFNNQPVCGNGTREAGEECDGNDLGSATCQSLGHLDGTLTCDASCNYDESGCYDTLCGNGVIEGQEECDATNLDGNDCTDFGYTGGSLACTQNCIFDVSGCTGGCSPTGGALSCGQSIQDNTTTSADAVDQVDSWIGPACLNWTMDGPEIVYEYTPGAGGQGIRATLTGLSSDLDLIVLQDEGAGCAPDLTCVRWSDNGGQADDAVSFFAEANTTYFIVVDGYAGSSGPFSLSFECVDAEICDDGQDNDGDGQTDCYDPDCQGAPECQEDCDDGQDNDADGQTDCADSDCFSDPACLVQQIYELFPTNDPGHTFDLDGTTITFVPDVNEPNGYAWSTQGGVAAYPTTPGTGTVVSTALNYTQANDTIQVNFSAGHQFSFYGTVYTSMWVNTHGNITFGQGDTNSQESRTALIQGPPRIAGHWDRYDVMHFNSGPVVVDEFNDRIVVTWDGVADPNANNQPVRFQVTLYFNGNIAITNLNHQGVDGLVGISEGGGNNGADEVDFYYSSVRGFYEHFVPNQGDSFDLDGRLIIFTPDAMAPQGYTYQVNASTVTFPFSPGNGTISSQQLNFPGGDTSLQFNLTGANAVPFYAVDRDNFYVGTNGYITFGAGDNRWTESAQVHFEMERISGVFNDWEPQNGGQVWVDEYMTAGVYTVAVTFIDVPLFGNPSATGTFQMAISSTGAIMVYFNGVDTNDGLTGISSGQTGTLPPETNFVP